MESKFQEKKLWGNLFEMIKAFEDGLQTDDIEYKQLCLSVLLGHFIYVVYQMEMLPDTIPHAEKFKKILRELSLEHL
jgi:hypothetical protein